MNRSLNRHESGESEPIVTNERVIADLRDENERLLAANRDVMTHFEALREDFNVMAHFVVDLRAILARPDCIFSDLLMTARDTALDAERYRWLLSDGLGLAPSMYPGSGLRAGDRLYAAPQPGSVVVSEEMVETAKRAWYSAFGADPEAGINEAMRAALTAALGGSK